MNFTEARRRIDNIKRLAASGDFEAAHAEEDALHLDTLLFIANDADLSRAEVRHLAWLVSTTRDIQFQRVTA